MFSYHLFIWLYPKLIRIAALVNPKAGLWIRGRKQVFAELTAFFSGNTAPVIWLHAASLGEFEQGLPVLEQLRVQYPSHRILVSFFSPSGYEIRKNHPVADYVCYLPMDSKANARRFLSIVNPALVLFVKYEFWYHYLREIHHRNIPLLLVSGIFRENQIFFRWYGKAYRKMLSFFTALLVQDEDSAALVASTGMVKETVITGDTRFDRVLTIAGSFSELPPIAEFCGHHPVIVAGSTWTDDDEELDHFANTHPEIRFIIAPHDIGADRLEECRKLYSRSILYSDWRNNRSAISGEPNVLIIDNIGMLSSLYHYATIAYIGGGFGEEGIHNILEAAVYNKPVIFGPVYDKYLEASEMLETGGAFSVEDALSLEKILLALLDNTEKLHHAGNAAGNYVRAKAGATAKVTGFIQANRLLIN